MASDLAGQTLPVNVQKHRACDECRSRKLACSKEADGCARCRREGIHCHYSPQKPMGRPRKRRFIEDQSPPLGTVDQTAVTSRVSRGSRSGSSHGDSNDVPATAIDGTGEPSTGQRTHHPQPTHKQQPPPTSIDPSLNFWNHQPPVNEAGTTSFIDLLPNNFFNDAGGSLLSNHHHHPGHDPQLFLDQLATDPCNGEHFHSNLCHGADLLQGTGLGNPEPSVASVSRDISNCLYRQMSTQQYPEPADIFATTPELTASSPSDMSKTSDVSHANDSPEPFPSPGLRSMPTITCGCLSSLYLALDSLSHLPHDVPAAMRIVRNASKVAHDVVNCPYCFQFDETNPISTPPIQSFQNLMCLGALVPSACNAYAYIMEMIDRDTERAKQQNRTIWFTFKDIGGLWGEVSDATAEQALGAYDRQHLAPDLWRTTIRAILRLDIYGLDDVPEGVLATDASREIGLRNVIIRLSEKSKRRHDIMDELVDSGKAPVHSPYILCTANKIPPENRNCVRVLETARMALDKLIIS